MVATVNTIENAGKEQFQVFAEERFVNRKKEVTDVIRLKKFALFSNPRTSSTKKKARCRLPEAELFPVFAVIHFL